jgi:membrane protease YdiL (CAAX protease family)
VFPEPSPPVAGSLAQPTVDSALTKSRALFEVLLCSGYPTQLAIVAALQAVGIHSMVEGELSPLFVFVVSGLDTVLLLGLVFAFLHRSNERPSAVFCGGRPIAGELAYGVLLVPALFILMALAQLLIQNLLPHLRNVPVNPFESLLESPLARAAFIILVVLAGGVREEFQRAFLLHRFEQRLGGGAVGVIVTSVAFGLGHTLQGLDAAIVTALLGACWGLVYLARRSVVANVTSHGLFNALQVLLGFSSRIGT